MTKQAGQHGRTALPLRASASTAVQLSSFAKAGEQELFTAEGTEVDCWTAQR